MTEDVRRSINAVKIARLILEENRELYSFHIYGDALQQRYADAAINFLKEINRLDSKQSRQAAEMDAG
jgi:hypothetical protein